MPLRRLPHQAGVESSVTGVQLWAGGWCTTSGSPSTQLPERLLPPAHWPGAPRRGRQAADATSRAGCRGSSQISQESWLFVLRGESRLPC